MDFVKSQLDRIQQQLAGLSATQKMLTFALVAIMVMTMAWWGKYAGTAEMEPVLNQAFPDEQISRITAALDAKGIPHSVGGDRKILVPTDRKLEVLADLSYSQLLPANIETGFDQITKQLNPFTPNDTSAKMWNHASEMTLSQVISRFPGVRSAVVMIDPTQKRTLDGGIQPTATVNITMNSGVAVGKQLVNAAADLVAGAQSGLAKNRVKVIVDGVSQKVQDSSAGTLGSADDYLELKQIHERFLSDKIAQQLQFIRGVIVSVTVDIDTKAIAEERRLVDPKEFIHKPIEESTRTEESNTPGGGGGGESGVSPNTQANSPAFVSGGGGSTNTITEEKTKYELRTSETFTKSQTAAGKGTVVGASVRVPISYFQQMWQSRNPNGKVPDDAVLQPLVDAELPRIRNDVKRCTGLEKDDSISVETYTDVMPMLAAGAVAASPTSAVSLSLGSYAKEIAVGILAMGSLGLMMMMVRKSSPAPAMAPAREARTIGRLGGDELVAGEAGEGGQALDGMELDEDTVKAKQMLEQVSTMVKENPDAAAGLVKRWLNRS